MGYVIPPHPSGPDMSFLHIHLVRICHSSTYILSEYDILPHPPCPDLSFLHIHLIWICPDVCMWRNDISGPDGCGGMIYPDEMDVEE
jgi:hypothetical protein